MTKQAILNKYAELEGSTNSFRYSRAEALEPILKAFEEIGDSDELEKFKIEFAAFRLCENGDYFQGHFQPMLAYTDGTTSPPIGYFSDDKIEYLLKKAQDTENPIHSARFADVAWDLAKKKNLLSAELAIEAYLKCIDLYKANGWGVEYGAAIIRAVELAAQIADKPRLDVLKNKILLELDELNSQKDYRFCLDIVDALKKGQKTLHFSEREKETILSIINNAVNYYSGVAPNRDDSLGPTSAPSWHFVRSFLDAANSLRKMFGVRPDVTAYKKSLADAYVREAEGRDPIARLVFLQDAEKLYREAGLASEQSKVLVQLGVAGKQAEAEMKQISVPFEINKDEIESYIAPLVGVNIVDSLNRFAMCNYFYPSSDTALQVVERSRRRFTLAAIARVVTLKNGYPCKDSAGEYAAAFVKDFILGIGVGGIFRARFFERLRREQLLDGGVLLAHFARWGYCNGDHLELLKVGFDAYFREEYVSAIHVLVPQFEGIFRNFLEKSGCNIYDAKDKKFRLLGALLRDPLFLDIAGENQVLWYKLTLSEPGGLNLRNEVAHGLCSKTLFTKNNTELVLQLLLSLTGFEIEEPAVVA